MCAVNSAVIRDRGISTVTCTRLGSECEVRAKHDPDLVIVISWHPDL
jgi:hypothetical protein